MFVLGIDIGGTKCAAVLADCEKADKPDELIIDKLSFPTDVERGWKKITSQLLDTAQELLEKNAVNAKQLKAVGISCGGPLDSKKGIICCPPNLLDWDNVPIVKLFTERFGVEARLQNDANACAVAEWKLGAGKGLDSLVFLTFGTGMGAGLILDGRLYSGACDLAGEVGHIRLADDGPMGYGKRGSFEGFCSGGGIARMANEMIPDAKKAGIDSPLFSVTAEITAKSIAQAAKLGDKFAVSVYRRCAERLGQGLSLLIDLLNPQAIIIGSIYQRSRELFDEIIDEVIRRETLEPSAKSCRILPAALADKIGDFAAISLALE